MKRLFIAIMILVLSALPGAFGKLNDSVLIDTLSVLLKNPVSTNEQVDRLNEFVDRLIIDDKVSDELIDE